MAINISFLPEEINLYIPPRNAWASQFDFTSLDLTGKTITASLYNDRTLAEIPMTVTVVDLEAGSFIVSMTTAEMEAIEDGFYQWWIDAELNGEIQTIGYGVMVITSKSPDLENLYAVNGTVVIAGTPGIIPAGGTLNQVLSKKSATDYDLYWRTVSGGSGGGAVVLVNGVEQTEIDINSTTPVATAGTVNAIVSIAVDGKVSFKVPTALASLGYTPENVANIRTSFQGTPDNTHYPSEKLVKDQLDLKVDKVTGKGLSTNDFTTVEQSKLAGIEAGAEVNVQADWNASSGDAQILNKPTISGSNTGDETATRIAAINHGAAEKTTLIDADEITGQNSANSFSLIRTTWTNVKAFLKTYFDTLYTLSNLGGVPTSRTITATTPVTIDGTTSADLSANRTIAIPAATALVPGHMTAAYASKLEGVAENANNYVHPNHSGEVTSTGDGAQVIPNRTMIIRCIDIATSLTVADNIFNFPIPALLNGKKLSACHAQVDTAGVTGTSTFNFALNGTAMLSTVLSIDSTETGSNTSATAYVIDTAHDDVATYDIFRIDVKSISTTAPKGLTITLVFNA
jgi:hypothetical protein